MALSMIAGLAGAGLNLAGGISSYYASRANASIARAQGRIDNAVAQANAEAIELSGMEDAKVVFNNAQAKANQKMFENSLLSANRQLIIQKGALANEEYSRNIRATTAQAKAANPHLSSDVIKSMELESFYKIASGNIDTAAQLQSIDAQMTDNQRVGKYELQLAAYEGNKVRRASQNNAFYTRLSGQNALSSANLRAGQMKLQARSDLIGSFASSASSAATYLN
jgi:putative sterol carrier protein